MRRTLLWKTGAILLTVSALSGPAIAQSNDQTLADIRQELSVLYVEVQKLRRELSTTGGASTGSVGGSVIDRVGAIEVELQRLTAKTEELEFRVDRVVKDGTNRIGDLEFRLCELESGCDISTLGQGTTLGGGELPTGGNSSQSVSTDTATSGDIQLAVGEKADFDSAIATLEKQDYSTAASLFANFLTNYPGSPLSNQARLKQGAAYEGAGENTQAARAYLNAFSSDPNGATAPEALFLLGRSLGRIGQVEEACVTLSEVSLRFPGAPASADAQAERQRLTCS